MTEYPPQFELSLEVFRQLKQRAQVIALVSCHGDKIGKPA